ILRVTSRRVAGEDADLPPQVEAEPPLSASFLSAPRDEEDRGPIIGSWRDVEVTIPPSRESGARNGRILFRWEDGRTKGQSLAWEVVPPIRVSPKHLVLKRSDREAPLSISIRSDGRPFRII